MRENDESRIGENVGATQAEFDEKWRISSLPNYREKLRQDFLKAANLAEYEMLGMIDEALINADKEQQQWDKEGKWDKLEKGEKRKTRKKK